MPSLPLTRRHVPALALLVAGLGLVALAGAGMYDVSRTKYDYEVSPYDGAGFGFGFPDGGVYVASNLSDPAKTVLERARDDEVNASVGDTLAAAPEFDGPGEGSVYDPDAENRSYLLREDGQYVCLIVTPPDRTGQQTASVDPDCASTERGPLVHDFADLSPEAQDVFLAALRDDDGEISRYGDTPDGLRSGGDDSGLNDGEYVVYNDGAFYELSVFGRSGLGIAFLWGALFVTGTIGLVTAGVAGVSLREPRVRLPTALLAGLLVFFGPILLAQFGPLDRSTIGANISTLFWLGMAVPFLVWGALYVLDVR